MSSITDTEKINFIKNNFHQYFDLTLNQSISTTETVNLVIPIETISETNIVSDPFGEYHHDITLPENYKVNDILSKYENTEYTGIKCICTKVIDGDTIKVKIPIEKEDGTIGFENKIIRLTGVNTPEEGKQGYEVSKDFLEKVCFDEKYLKRLSYERGNITLSEKEIEYYSEVENSKKIFYKEDSISPNGRNNQDTRRFYGIIIVNNKNINEVILKERLGELWYIPPSEFPSYKWINPDTSIHVENFQNDSIKTLFPYFNSELTNVVFTPRDDITKIYQYEVYKGVYYIKLQPFSQNIRMHLLPKSYDCSNEILILKDDMTKPNIIKSDDYYYFENGNPINSYYIENGEIRDRENISDRTYNINDWEETFCDFSYDIKNSTKTFKNLQICMGYRYNNSTPFYSVHFSGVRDNTNVQIKDRCTLIDVNFDEIENKSNNITQYHYTQNKELYLPKDPRDIKEPNTYIDIDHVSIIGETNHKILKYINDFLYSEEYYKEINDNNITYLKSSTVAEWEDLSRTD